MDLNLQDVPRDELLAELARRSREEHIASLPKASDSPDLTRTMELCQTFITNPHDGKMGSMSPRVWEVFRELMEALYGPDIHDWMKSHMDY